MEEQRSESIEDEQDDIKDENYPDPPVLSPVIAMDKISANNEEKQSDSPPSVELVASAVNNKQISPVKIVLEESKKKYSKVKKRVHEYQFQLKQHHIIKGQKLFKCDICAGTYRYAFSLKRHFLRNHINYRYLSDADISNCNINVSLIIGNQQRLKLKNNEQESSKEQQLPQESANVSTDGNQTIFPDLYCCYLCWEYYHDKNELKTHVEGHSLVENKKEFKCEKCEITFTLKKNLLRHLSIHNIEKKFICKYCSIPFLSLSSQKKHERSHIGKKSYNCMYCMAVFVHNNDLKEHIQNQHKDYFHPCSICSKFFDCEQSLCEHVEQHVELPLSSNMPKRNSPLTNEGDNAAFLYDRSKANDTLMKFDYTCNVCKKKFMSYVNMCRHRRLAHNTSAKKRGRPQKSKIKIDNENNISHNEIPGISQSNFYTSIAQKISDNLVNYVDGKYFHLEQYHELNSSEGPFYNQTDISWDAYNFPPNFDYYKLDLSEPEIDKINANENSYEDVYNTANKENMSIGMDLSSNESLEIDDENYLDTDDDDDDDENNNNNNTLSEDKEKNYNIQLIGQTIPLMYICCACLERFHSLVAIEEHKINNHPNVFCTHIEIEGEKNVPPEFCKQFCSPVGVLKGCIVPSLNAQENNGLTCTKCQQVLNSVSDLHLHILECGGDGNFKNFKNESYGKRKGLKRRKLRQTKCQTYSPQKKRNIERSPKSKISKDNEIDELCKIVEENDVTHQTYTCKDCTKMFNHSSTFERHKRSCRQKLTLEISSHRKHQKKNRKNAGQHICRYCKRAFTYLTSLKKHIKDICLKKKLSSKNKISISNINKTKCTKKISDQTECLNVQSNCTDCIVNTEINEVKDSEKSPQLSENIGENFLKILYKKPENHLKRESENSSECSNKRDISNDSSSKTDLLLEPEDLLTLKEIENNESINDELLLEGDPSVKQEMNIQSGLFPQQRCCPHCLRSFAYLANYRRHVKDVCPVKKQLVKETEGNSGKLRASLPMYSVTTLSVKGKIEDSVIGLLRDQSRQSEMMRGSELEESSPAPPRFRSFSCKVCHKIFLSFVKMLQHRLSHKLQSDESDDLPKLDLGLMEKLQEDSLENSEYEQQNAQEIFNNLDNLLIKNENKVEKESNNSLLNIPEVSSENLEINKDDNSKASHKQDGKDCEVCGKSFANAIYKHRHYRLAHKNLIVKKKSPVSSVAIKKIDKNAKTKIEINTLKLGKLKIAKKLSDCEKQTTVLPEENDKTSPNISKSLPD